MIKIKRGYQELKFHTFDKPQDIPESIIEMTETFVNTLRNMRSEYSNGKIGFYEDKDILIKAYQRAIELRYTFDMIYRFREELIARKYGLTFISQVEIHNLSKIAALYEGNLDKTNIAYFYMVIAEQLKNMVYTNKLMDNLIENKFDDTGYRLIGAAGFDMNTKHLPPGYSLKWYYHWRKNYAL